MKVRHSPLLLAAVLLVVAGCSDSFLENKKKEPTNVDDRLAVAGRVCTAPPDPRGFPVKVVFVVDQSGSMCVSDPPGAQQSPGFCEAFAALLPGITQPARVRALQQLLTGFTTPDSLGNIPNVQVSIIPFETNVIRGPYTATGNFTPAADISGNPDPNLLGAAAGLQSQLGKGTDYQGALAEAYATIVSDINNVSMNSPEQLPRTRYVVVFLTDGTPFPKCSADDMLSQYADDLNPNLTWADSFGAGDFCNLDDADINDPALIAVRQLAQFIPGTDRNQNYQLFAYVDRLMELKDQYNIGDIRLHTVLLFNEQAVTLCGPICQDLYGQYVRYPGGGAPPVPVANGPAAAKAIARWLLQQFAARGNGVYQEFNDFSGVGALSLGALDYSSLASRNVMKTLLVQHLSSEPGLDRRVLDTDGDGLIDDFDNDFTWNTNPFFTDSDDDGFSDSFEVRHRDDGFRTDAKDGRGCDPMSPLSPGCTVRDTDGDGLSSYAEDYLRTRKSLVDSDGDGLPDGLEVKYGLDPLSRQSAQLDTDGDTVPDSEEFKLGGNPIKADKGFMDRNGYQYEVVSELQGDGSICYDFNVSNLQLVTPPNRAGSKQGFNLFKLWFGEAPESGVATDYGVWRTACAWAQFDPPSCRQPAGPETQAFVDADFVAPSAMVDPYSNEGQCVGVGPSAGQSRNCQ